MFSRHHYLTLALTPYIGPISFAAILQRFPNPEDALKASRNDLLPCLEFPEKAWSFLQSNEAEKHVQAALAWEKEPNCRIMTLWDDDYPILLAQGMAPPPVLFLRGNDTLLSQTMIAIVGSRKASAPALRTAESWAKDIAAAGFTVVSGFANGIDTAAHRGAISETGSTIAILGNGIDRVYPAGNRDLAHQMAEKGLLLSEFPIGTAPTAQNFPRRNRIIAGLSHATIVIEAALKSGSLITARLAGELGRDVMAVPGSIYNPLSRGCHQLIQDGAKLVQYSSDILEEYPTPKKNKPLDKKQKTKLDQVQQKQDDSPQNAENTHPILDAMGFDPIHPDELAQILNLSTAEILSTLLELELSGQISTASGGRYQRI